MLTFLIPISFECIEGLQCLDEVSASVELLGMLLRDLRIHHLRLIDPHEQLHTEILYLVFSLFFRFHYVSRSYPLDEI